MVEPFSIGCVLIGPVAGVDLLLGILNTASRSVTIDMEGDGVLIDGVSLYRIDHLYRRWLPWAMELTCRPARFLLECRAFMLKTLCVPKTSSELMT